VFLQARKRTWRAASRRLTSRVASAGIVARPAYKADRRGQGVRPLGPAGAPNLSKITRPRTEHRQVRISILADAPARHVRSSCALTLLSLRASTCRAARARPCAPRGPHWRFWTV